ncbi:type IV secretion system DNA-binding domain-containing protein [Rhizobium leguminosarum]|uniref:type IV secretory system conjugative DNA transfer family protein n=1 Tax=Rhizobium leguminosarum TaxID=384 RepID=UPI001C953586|nr:TraM recognition domain-containing protein [Rhizobium leguminosarum]MBY5453975.1 type IV secretion system DNA-binding domain-containing protein [Rhizobium leguminosarum]
MFEYLSKKALRATHRLFPKSVDLIAMGERAFPRHQHPALWLELPKDLQRGLLWDGKLPNGYDPAELSFYEMKESRLIELGGMAGRRALKITAILAAGVSALAFPAFLPVINALPAFPSWAVDTYAFGAIGAWALQSAAMLVWTTATVVISNGWPLALLLPVFWYFAFIQGMQPLWDSVSRNMRLPTIDALALWHSNATRRAEAYEAYNQLAVDVAERLGEYPVFPIGISTGAMAAAGVAGAPAKGTLVSIDGDSIKRHMIVFGDTGTGKTRLVLQPLFRRIVIDAIWPAGHKAGAYITDGKGVLWKELLPFCGRRADEVKVIGIEPGHYGIDLVKGMTPPQIAEALKGVGMQLGGDSGGKDKFWVDKAAAIIKNTAWIALALDTDEEVRAAFARSENCRPYSLLGIYRLAINERLAEHAIARVKDLANMHDDEADPETGRLYRKAVEAGTWLVTQYHTIAETTKSGFKSNVESLLSLIEDDDQLTDRFCTGTFPEEQTMEIDYCLNGGITMLAIGAGVGEGEMGKFIAIWLKTRLMQTARARNAADPQIADKFSCAMFADEYQMLVTSGTTNSCQQFWNVARSSGLYLIAASQSIAAIEQAVGNTTARNILSNMSTRILLRTKDKGTLEYYRDLLGKSMQVISTLKGVWSNHAQIEQHFGKPRPRFYLDMMAGLVPTRFMPDTKPFPAYNIDHLMRLNEELPPEKQESKANIIKRQEDMISKAISESSQWRDKMDIDRLTTGSGYALVIAERGTGTRYDFVDLKPLLNA